MVSLQVRFTQCEPTTSRLLLSVCGHLATLRVSCPSLRQNPWGWPSKH